MRRVLVTCALAPLALAGCASSPAPTTSTPAATGTASVAMSGPGGPCSSLTVTDPWVKAADTGMTGAFAQIRNTGKDPVRLVSVSGPASSKHELHETVASPSGGMAMREKQGGFAIAAGSTLELRPGGNHIMLMGLITPLRSGTTTTLTLTCGDTTTQQVTLPVRVYAGAQETYAPGSGTGTHHMSTTGSMGGPSTSRG